MWDGYIPDAQDEVPEPTPEQSAKKVLDTALKPKIESLSKTQQAIAFADENAEQLKEYAKKVGYFKRNSLLFNFLRSHFYGIETRTVEFYFLKKGYVNFSTISVIFFALLSVVAWHSFEMFWLTESDTPLVLFIFLYIAIYGCVYSLICILIYTLTVTTDT